jgi:hypothetical protein
MGPAVSTHELHWLAGLLEGEGSFTAGPPSSPRMPVISVNMTDEDVVARLGRIPGASDRRRRRSVDDAAEGR